MKQLAVASFLCAVIHIAAGVLSMIALVPGSAEHPTLDRILHIRTETTLWKAAWGGWALAALSLVWFYARFKLVLSSKEKATTTTAVMIAFAGLIPDLSSAALQTIVVPGIAVRPTGAPGLSLEEIDGMSLLLAGGLGNGAYTLAGMLLCLAAYRTPGFPRALLWISAPVWASGIALSAVSFLKEQSLVPPAAGAILGLFTLWTLVVGVWAARKRKAVDTPTPVDTIDPRHGSE